MLVIIKTSDSLHTFLKQPPYFTKSLFLQGKPEDPIYVLLDVGGGWGEILKTYTLLYKGGEFQLSTRLLISFSHDF